MPYNGSGAFLPPGADFPAVSGTLIQATKFNNVINDLATGLSTAIAKDGQTTITANLPMAGFRHTGVSNASARDQYATADQVQDGDLIYAGTAGGTADALTLSTTPAFTAYVTGMSILFKSSASPNTGAATVVVNGISGAKAIQNNGAALIANDIAASKWYRIVYDGTAFQLAEHISPTAFGKSIFIAATATAARTLLDVPSNAEALLDTFFAAKGDLITASANDTPALLTVGANDTFLLADSVQAGGLKWGSVNSLTEDTAPDLGADFLLSYDTSAGVMKKVLAGRIGVTLGTEQASTSGTAIDFTSIPSWVKRIIIHLVDVSTNGNSNIQVQIGDSGGIETSGYDSVSARISGSSASVASTAGFLVITTPNVADTFSGTIILTLEDASDFTWSCISLVNKTTAVVVDIGAGHKALSAVLDRVRVTMANGTDTFDAGAINITYEG